MQSDSDDDSDFTTVGSDPDGEERFGRAATPEYRAYAVLLQQAQREAAKLNAMKDEIERLEALAEGRHRPARLRLARVSAMFAEAMIIVVAFGCNLLSRDYLAFLPGFMIYSHWAGDQAGLSFRNANAATNKMHTLRNGFAALFFTGLAVAIWPLLHWLESVISAAVLAGPFLLAAIAAYFGTSGDPIADRIHGELTAVRLAARESEKLISRLEEEIRRQQSSDLATLSRAAPWPFTRKNGDRSSK